MPHLKEVSSLYDLAIQPAMNVIHSHCRFLNHSYGSFDMELCKSHAETFKHYLLCLFGVFYLEQLHMSEFFRQNVDYDCRILLFLFCHEHVKIINTFCDPGLLYNNFLANNLSSCKVITHLDLSSLCTDYTLQVVSQNCPLLKYFNCKSRLILCDDGILKHAVSGHGLLNLIQCKKLSVIVLDNYVKNNVTRTVSISHVSLLLHNLPLIKNIVFDEIGRVLCLVNESKEYSLSHMYDCHPSVYHMNRISTLCKGLKFIKLSFTFKSHSAEQYDNIATAVFDSLISTELFLRYYDLENFRLNLAFFNFLLCKGQSIVVLDLKIDHITCDVLIAIGKSCPNITTLSMRETIDEQSIITCPQSWNINDLLFTKLKKLELYGHYWDPTSVLVLALSKADKIEDIGLYADITNNNFDDTFNHRINLNALCHLKKFSTYSKLRYNSIMYLAHLPVIENIMVSKTDDVLTRDLKMLKSELQNYKISITYYPYDL